MRQIHDNAFIIDELIKMQRIANENAVEIDTISEYISIYATMPSCKRYIAQPHIHTKKGE